MEWTVGWNDAHQKIFLMELHGPVMRENEVVEMGDANQVIEGGKNRTNVATTRTWPAIRSVVSGLIPTEGLSRTRRR